MVGCVFLVLQNHCFSFCRYLHICLILESMRCTGLLQSAILLFLVDFIVFDYPTQDHPIARWFRIGSFLTTVFQIGVSITVFISQVYLIQKTDTVSKSTVSDFQKKRKTVLKVLGTIISLRVWTIILFWGCLVVNDNPPAPGFFMYQSLIQMILSNFLILVTLMPILLNSIIALKFERRGKAQVLKLGPEER
jgi:hypothetical protein